MYAVLPGVSPGSVACGAVRATAMRTRVAPARRAFCNFSRKISPRVAANVRVIRLTALSWMRARIVGAGGGAEGLMQEPP